MTTTWGYIYIYIYPKKGETPNFMICVLSEKIIKRVVGQSVKVKMNGFGLLTCKLISNNVGLQQFI